MRVELDKIHIDSYKRIITDLNSFFKRFNPDNYSKGPEYESLILKKDISVEKKKGDLIKNLHNLTLKTFSLNIDKIKSEKKILEVLKGNIKTIRKLIDKLKDINYYLEESFFAELGLIKKDLKVFKSKNPEKLIEATRFSLNKKYIDRLEHTTYKLIEKTIIFDKKLLKGYKSKEEKVITKEKYEVKDLSNIIKRQSEILMHLDAKLPPPEKIKPLLIRKKIFNQWAPKVLSLLASLEAENKKELMIIKKFKNNQKLRKLLTKKITSIEKEKADLIKIKQKRVMGMSSLGKLDDEIRLMFHEFNAIRNL